MRKITLTLMVMLVSCCFWQLSAQTTCGNAPELIPATGTSGLMNDSVAAVAESGTIGTDYSIDNVALNLTHTWADDLEIVLVSPSGTRVALCTDNGGSTGLDAVGDLVFTDASVNDVTAWDNTAPLADYRAEGGDNVFSVATGDGPGVDLNTEFAGEPVNGNWTLQINDDVGGDTGNLNSFCITLTPLAPSPIGVCGNAPEPIPSTGTSGLMNDSVATVADSGVIGTDYSIDNVSLNLAHTWADDLEIVLVSPAGTRVALCTDNGGSTGLDAVSDLVFSDASVNDITAWDNTAPLADYRAEGGDNVFSVATGDGPGVDLNTEFAGESITGNWTLQINDDVGGDSGDLNSFCINFEPIVVPVGDPPVISCPMDVEVDNDAGVCGAVVNFADAVAIDPDGDLDTVEQTDGLPSGSEFPVGVSTVEFTATDLAGNTAVCTFTITVNDAEDPVADCDDHTIELGEDGTVTWNAEDFLANFGDNCGVASVVAGTPEPVSTALGTLFAANNGGAFGGAVYFDVTVGPSDVTVTALDVNTADGAGDPFSIEVFSFEGTYVGNETNGGLWSSVATGTGTAAGLNNPSTATLDASVVLSANTTYAMAVVMDANHGHDYTNGNGSNQSFTDGNITIDLGAGSNTPFTPTIFSPRVWNGAIHYDVVALSQDTTVTFDCDDVGVQEVTVTVTDDSGNMSTCVSTVTIEDNTAPEIVCIGEFAEFMVTVSDDPGVAIPDSDPVGVSTTISVTEDVEITDLDVNLDISHTWVGDLQVILESPAGTSVMMVDRPGEPDLGAFGCSEDDLIITLDDEAADPIEDECSGSPITGTYSPNNPLSAFDGESTMGDWILTVIDNAGGDTGTVNEWGFTYTYETVGAPLEVDLDANGMATIDASSLLLNVNEACGWTATVGGGGGDPLTLETTFAAGNNFNGNMFDVNVLNDVTFDSFDVNLDTGVSDDVEVWYKTGSFVGFEEDASAWTLLATASVTSAGANVPTPLDLDLGLSVSAGETVAFYVTTTLGGTMFYTNGTAVGNVFASDDNIEFLEGNGGGYPFAVTFSPRVWNGNIHYTAGAGISETIDFTCEDLGENQIEVTVTDDSGNVSTCIATVNVNDVTDPILVCQDVTIELDENGTAEIDPEALLATLPGTYEVITISSDNQSGAVGNTDLTVDVTEAADISFDWEYSTDDGPGFDGFGYLLNGVFTELTDPAGANNQSGSAGPISVAPGDVFGFRSSSLDGLFGASTTVVSNFMPGFEGQFDPDNWTLTLDNSDGDAFFVEIPGGPLSFDACGITVLAVDVTDVFCSDIGTPITATVFASDASGNIAACTSVITVVDAMGPMITCPEDQTVDPGEDNLFYEVPDYWGEGLATATDNCTDPVTITSQSPAAGELIPDGVYNVVLTAEDEYGNVSTCTFELTVESVLGISDSALDQAVAMYPNPAENQVTIHNSSSIALNVANIYDVNGKLVNTVDLSQMATEKTIDVSQLASGVYMVHIIGEEASAIKRLLKE